MNTVRSDGSGGNYDGIMEGFVDGKLVASYTGLRFRNVSTVHIDKMKIYSFFGGSGSQYGAARDEWTLIDDVYLFTYANGVNVPRGNIPSKPGRTLQLPNMNKNYGKSNTGWLSPKGPYNLKCTGISDSSANFTWDTPPDSSFSKFIIYTNGRETDTVFNSEYTLSHLLPGSKISFSLSALGHDGLLTQGNDTLVIVTSGIDKSPPTIPENLKEVKTQSNNIQISWTESSDNHEVAGYRIYLDGNVIGTTPSTEYTVQGLSPDTDYDLAVASFDQAANQSSLCTPLHITTKKVEKEELPAPTGLIVKTKTQRSVKISWDNSSDGVSVSGYVIFVNDRVRGTSFSPYFTIVGLSPGSEYRISVAAFDSLGNKSRPSEPLLVKTLR